MNALQAKKNIQELLSSAGIRVGGDNPWDIHVLNDKFYKKVLGGGSLAVGEAYMKNWWYSNCLDEFFARILSISLEEKLEKNWNVLVHVFRSRIINLASVSRAFNIGRHHYDLGNDLFSKMLDNRMIYTCAYWKNATTLDEAQEQKLKLTCEKLELNPGMTILDIGCGWGGFAKYAAERYGARVTGITVSEEQANAAKKICKGLPVHIKLLDYRQLEGQYDRVVSLGMFEHVGYKNYRVYMEKVNEYLKTDGLFLLHTIGTNVSSTWNDPWIEKYIFPGSLLPSIQQIGKAIEGLFVMEDWHNFGSDYDKTLLAWYKNFVDQWEHLKQKYDESFYRMWEYYLLSCAGAFRARKNQLWQIVLSKQGLRGGYISLR